ncbi:MAG TPA: hypothetical protein VGD53_13900 [Actinoallomurus sp.]
MSSYACDYLAAASHPEAGEGMLDRLARCPYTFVWQAVASHPRTPAVSAR